MWWRSPENMSMAQPCTHRGWSRRDHDPWPCGWHEFPFVCWRRCLHRHLLGLGPKWSTWRWDSQEAPILERAAVLPSLVAHFASKPTTVHKEKQWWNWCRPRHGRVSWEENFQSNFCLPQPQSSSPLLENKTKIQRKNEMADAQMLKTSPCFSFLYLSI